MTVFSRALVKVSRWELPTSHNNRRAFSSPSLSPETNHELACDSGQDRSASHSLKDVAAPYGLFDQETEQSDFATQLSEGKLGATRALNEQSGSNCESSNVPAPRGTSPAMPSSSTLGATVSTDTQQIDTICKSTNVPAPSGPTNVLAPASSSPGATLSCLNVGNHNDQQLGSYCKSTNVPAPSGPTNVLAPASSSPGATLSCLNVGNLNEQLGSYCKSTNVPAPSGPAFTLSASSLTKSGATLSCLNAGTHNERIGSFRESNKLAQRVQRAPSPTIRAAENGNNPISLQSSQTKTARATNNTLILSGKSASPTENLDFKGATNYTNMSGKSASSAVQSIMGGTAASSTAKSVLTVHGGTAASSSLITQSHDSKSNSAITVTVTGGITTASSTLSHDSNSNDDVTGGMTTASSTRSHDSDSTVTVTGGMTTASSTRSHDSISTVTVTGGITTASSTRSHDSNSTVTVTGGMTTASSTRSHDSNSTVTVSVTGGMTTASSTRPHDSNSTVTVTGGMTTASSTRSHDSNSTVTVTGGMTTASSTRSHDSNSTVTVTGGMMTASSTRSHDSNSTVTVTGGMTTASSTRSHDSNSTVTVTGGMTTASSTRSHDSNSTVTVTGGMTTASSTPGAGVPDNDSDNFIGTQSKTDVKPRSNCTCTCNCNTHTDTNSDTTEATLSMSASVNRRGTRTLPYSSSTTGATIRFLTHLLVYYLMLLIFSLNRFSGSASSILHKLKHQKCTSNLYAVSPLSFKANTTMEEHLSTTENEIMITERTMSFGTYVIVYYLMLLVYYLVKKSKEYCGMVVISLLNSISSKCNSDSETALTLRSSKVYTASSTKANKSFFTHLIVFFMILLVNSLISSDQPVKSSPNSKTSLSTTFAIFNFTSEGNRTSTMSIWSASSTAGPTMSFCTHVIVYYLMLLVYSFVKKAKECGVKFVRSFLNFNNSESAPSKVYSPCNFCNRDITYGEIMEQQKPAIYSPVTPLYTACECRTFDVDNCLELDHKPCPNAWFDSRLHEKNKSLFEYFENSAVRGMLFDTQITVATAVELFGIPLPVSGSVLEVELLLYQLQDEYHFTLKCADCGEILSTPVICGGGKTRNEKQEKTRNKRRKIGRKSKGKRKGAKAGTENAASDDIDIEFDSTANDDHDELINRNNDHESILTHADSDLNAKNVDILTAAFIDRDVTAESDDVDNTETTDDFFNETMLSDHSESDDNDNDHSDDDDDDTSEIGTNFGNAVKTKSKQAKYNASNKGKAAKRKYDLGEKGKCNKAQRNEKYFKSNDGKAAKINAQKAYINKDEGKAAKSRADKTYSGTDGGKATKRKANETYTGTDGGKAAKRKANETYTGTDGGKAAKRKANVTYSGTDGGKAALSKATETYRGTEGGKAALSKAIETYRGTDGGKAALSKAIKTYHGTDGGKAALSKAIKTYSGTDEGRAARSAATEAHALTEKRRASRKRYARTKKEYMRSYTPLYRDCEKIRINFSSEKVAGNTNSLLNHTISPELAKNFKSFEKEIIRGRCLVSPPTQYSSVSARGNLRSATACYKLMLSRKLLSALEKVPVDDESWMTIQGMSKKALKRKHFNPRNRASMILAELAWLKRQQCITVLKIQLNRLSSYADAIISKMDIQEKESEKIIALLGLQSHQKASEPFMADISYVDGQPYNYEAEVQKFEEAKASDKKAPSHITYRCQENCILPNAKEDLINLKKLFGECAKLSDASPGEFRRFLRKFQWCTKRHEYPERERNDLDPNRMYLYPVKLRNHPRKCYLPAHSHSEDDTVQDITCRSQETTMRKFMVHYANPRKFHSIISKAITAHKLMCDIDASSILGDVEYLSKLVKIELQYDDSTVGFETSSEAREWTADSIEEKLAETAIQGKTSTTTFSHRDLFDKNRNELPSVRCYSCNKLVTPKQSSTLNLNTAKKLEYDPENSKNPNQAFQRFHDFLLQKGIVQPEIDTDNGDSLENHPTRLLHGLSICRSCRESLNKGEIPANSMMNNLYIGETPEVLKVLNPIELMFVSKTKCFQTIIKPGPISNKLPRSERLSAVKGNMIHLPLSTSITAETLYKSATERLFEEAEDNVLLYGKPNKDREVWNHIVDRKKVLAALKWLCENNPNYKDIVVPEVAEDILPHVFGYECDLCQMLFETATERNEHNRVCSNASPHCSNDSSNNQSNYLSESNYESYTNPRLPNCSQSLDFECKIDSENDFADQCYDSESDLSSDESDPGVEYPECNQDIPVLKSCKNCKKEFNSEVEYKAHESNCSTSSVKSDSDQSHTDIKEKPWIEQVPKGSLKDGFRHFRTVGNDAKETQAKDIFQMLNIGANPIPYYEPNVDCESFPEQFPYGTGGRTALREKKLQDATFEQTRLMTSDNYQRRNIQYILHLVGQKEKRLIKEGIFSVQNKSFQSMTKKDICDNARDENSELLKRITSVLRKLPTQREFWNEIRSKVEAMVFEFGPPTFWATFSPGEYDDQEMLRYLRERNSDIPGVEKMTVSQLVCKDPILACTYLQTKFDATLKFMLSDANPIGKIKHHFVRTEYQTRLMPHFHCFFWVEDAPIIGRDSEDTILNFIGKYISCKLPSPNEDPVMFGLVKKYQLHHCNRYCLRKPKKGRGKARCKFSFPRAASLKPILHGVASSIASHKTGSYKKRLYEVERKHNERYINDYNPTLLYLWKGNVDIQFIGEESESLVDYISKYATKAPRSAISDFELDAIQVNSKSNFGKLFQLASKLMKDRELGAMEARNFLLSEKPVQTNASFMFINTVYASKRKSVLKSKKDLESLPDDSKDIYYGDLIGTWYPKRPPYDKSNGNLNLKEMSLFEFAKTYERVGNAAAAQIKDKSKLLRLDGNAGFMKRRTNDPKKNTLVIYGPSQLDPIKDSEAYYFAFLLLHKPFWHEHLLMGKSRSYQEEFERLIVKLPAMAAHEKKFRMKKNFREKMENDADAQADLLCAEENDSDPQNVDSGSDLFETVRKQTEIETVEQLREAVKGLSPDQFAVYESFVKNVEHYYQHKTKSCSCGKFEPLRLFVSGFGGSGKSHLIRILMAYQFIRSEVEKEPCHFLLGAPTGIASHNIGGMTLHSMWNLPVNHGNSKRNSNEEYQKLRSGQINKMRANYKHACGLIVDEVSMISNRMLMAINLRMNEVVGSKNHEPFGGIPTVMFGDLFQLEPVNGCQPFIPLSSSVAQKMFGGFPCAPNLWRVFQFRQLNTNHRQQGEENQKWRATLDHARYGMLSASDIKYLNQRMIDTSGCKLQNDYLDRYVEKFLECEEEGLGPVCLLPANKMVKEFNHAVMEKKGEIPETVKSIDIFSGRNDELLSAAKKILPDLESDKTGGLEAELDIAINTRVMLRVNDKRTPGLVNGARGTVCDILSENTKAGRVPKEIVVKFDGIDQVQTIERIERKFQVLSNCYVYRSMFPLINSYAMTIHKSQSLSLPCVFADLGDRIFADGMSYVALSRCLSHKGLYLLNFKPESVKASNKACKEYGRLMDKGSFKGNNGCKLRIKIERPWYTSFVQDKATKLTKDKMKETAAGKRKGRSTTPTAKKTEYSNKSNEEFKTNTESIHNSVKGNEPVPRKKKCRKPTKAPKSDNLDNNDHGNANIKSETPYLPDIKNKSETYTKHEVVNEKPTSSQGNKSPGNNIVVVSEHIRPINYVPVDEVWQRSICNAFSWTYTAPSRGRALNNLYGINSKTPPKDPTYIEGDGNCWFRAIALIATGDQENYMQVKNSVMEFMWANIDMLQKTFQDLPYYRDMYTSRIRFTPRFAREVILFHSQPNEWVKNPVMEMTAVMLNTRFYLYYAGRKGKNGSWTSIDNGSYPLWFRRDQIRNYPGSVNCEIIPELGERSLYINHKNQNHFETCHDIGLKIGLR